MSTNHIRPFCKIVLQNPKNLDTKILTWKLLNHSVVNRWIELIQSCNANNPFVEYVSWGCTSLNDQQNKRSTIMSSMNESIEMFNRNNGYGFSIAKLSDKFTQDDLNRIHSEFEYYADLFLEVNTDNKSKQYPLLWEKNKLEYHLGNINTCVHDMEKILEINPDYVSGSFSFYYNNRNNLPIRTFLRQEDYSLFTLAYQFGDLLLGYDTTGKNLFHIYKNNDLDLLNRVRASPQQTLSTNTLCMLYEGTDDENERGPFRKWFCDHKLETKGYDFDDIKNSIGYIPLGHLCWDSSIGKQNFINSIANYSVILSLFFSRTELP